MFSRLLWYSDSLIIRVLEELILSRFSFLTQFLKDRTFYNTEDFGSLLNWILGLSMLESFEDFRVIFENIGAVFRSSEIADSDA